jgi:DNA-binding transcriptional ArsR family regulator
MVRGHPIVKRMLNQPANVDRVLGALGDPTRRQCVEMLGNGPAPVSQLAAPFAMSLPAVMQHLRVLEASGLVVSTKVGRVRTCSLEADQLRTVQDWIDAQRRTWDARLDRLGAVLAKSRPIKAKPDQRGDPR